jgi:tRNA(fMet)-specific endonuclease VapC
MEEVLYDTGALINLLKSGKRAARGFTTILNILEFPKALDLKELAILYPTVEDYDEALKIAVSLLKIGKPVPAIDIMIAAMCLRRDLLLLTTNGHFSHIKLTESEFDVRLVE